MALAHTRGMRQGSDTGTWTRASIAAVLILLVAFQLAIAGFVLFAFWALGQMGGDAVLPGAFG